MQLLLSHCPFATLAAFMVTTPATRVYFGGDYSSLLVTRWDSFGWCDAHDCIAHLLTWFAPWDEVIILMLYAIYKWSQINPSWVSDSQCDCMYVLAFTKKHFWVELSWVELRIICNIIIASQISRQSCSKYFGWVEFLCFLYHSTGS